MTVETFLPDEELRSWVDSLLIVRSEEDAIRTLPPQTAPVLVFRIRGTTAEQLADGERVIPRLGITGLNRSPRIIHYHKQSELLLVRFRDSGTAGLVDAPMEELTGDSLRLDSLVNPRLVHETEEKLEETSNSEGRIAVIQDFLKSQRIDHAIDPLVVEAIRRIYRSRGIIEVRALVRDLATNLDTLEKRFRHLLGGTPKLFSRIVRIRSFVHRYSTHTNLTDAALEAGFYDHAHLVKEFRTFTGQTPTAFFLTPPHW